MTIEEGLQQVKALKKAFACCKNSFASLGGIVDFLPFCYVLREEKEKRECTPSTKEKCKEIRDILFQVHKMSWELRDALLRKQGQKETRFRILNNFLRKIIWKEGGEK